MYRFLSKYELTREPGYQIRILQLWIRFSSYLLSRIAKRSYPDLAKQMVFYPLNMRDTTFNPRMNKERTCHRYERGVGSLHSKVKSSIRSLSDQEGLTQQPKICWFSYPSTLQKRKLVSMQFFLSCRPHITHLVNSKWGWGGRLFPMETQNFSS